MLPEAERCSRKVKLDKSSLLIEKAIGDGDDVRKKVQKAATNNIDTFTLTPSPLLSHTTTTTTTTTIKHLIRASEDRK